MMIAVAVLIVLVLAVYSLRWMLHRAELDADDNDD